MPGEALGDALLQEKLFPQQWPPGMSSDVLVREDADGIQGLMQSVTRGDKGWLGLMAVTATARRAGCARDLAEEAIARFPSGVTEVEVLAIPGNYLYPGLDPRWTGALCFLESLGFERFKDCVNLTVHLDQDFPIAGETKRLADRDVKVRRATPADDALLVDFFAEQFGDDWLFECRRAMENDPAGLHLALREGKVLGFSAHSGQNRAWGFFGPMGTSPQARGLGIGRVLLWHCLDDLRGMGHRTAMIPWVGPISFYHHATAAVVERVFWRYRRDRVRKKT